MGSDFSNDDLVKQSDLAKDYKITHSKTDQEHQLSLSPLPGTVTVWGKIFVRIDRSSLMPIEQSFFDEKGEKIRQLNFKDHRLLAGRMLPSTLEMIPLRKKEQKTTVRYLSLDLDPKLKASFFSLRNLKKRP